VGFSSLEEFIYRNWAGIDWGTDLKLHKTAKHGGRQFPAGPWRIDFLALDAPANDLVVVHLKRGMASDSTVGQVLRRISWIKENVAEKGQNVRGIVIAKETDAALEYAFKDLPFVELRTYTVDFRLSLGPSRVWTAANSAEHGETTQKDDSGNGSQPKSEALVSG
jgi:restriction system protein